MNPVAWVWRMWHEIHVDSLAPAAVPAEPARTRKKGMPAPVAAVTPGPALRVDWKPIVILVAVAISLSVQEYVGDRGVFQRLATRLNLAIDARWWELWSFVWWTSWRVLGYLVFPMIVVALLPGERLAEYGWSFRGFTRHVRIYAVLFVGVFPLIYLMSTTQAFRDIYPFYRLTHRSWFDFVAWELLYAAQFLSLEFFFRGFMLHGLKRAVGVHAIWVMVVPYCMIHYGKTFAETMGAIVAGLILGTVSLRTKSIWGGVLIHIGVALSMDIFCIQDCPANGPCPRSSR